MFVATSGFVAGLMSAMLTFRMVGATAILAAGFAGSMLFAARVFSFSTVLKASGLNGVRVSLIGVAAAVIEG